MMLSRLSNGYGRVFDPGQRQQFQPAPVPQPMMPQPQMPRATWQMGMPLSGIGQPMGDGAAPTAPAGMPTRVDGVPQGFGVPQAPPNFGSQAGWRPPAFPAPSANFGSPMTHGMGATCPTCGGSLRNQAF